jgi:polysaccharide export outer membrane protein
MAALNEQIATEKKKLGLARQRIADYDQMMKKSLGLRSTEIELKLAEAQLESNLWKLTADFSRMQMNSGDLDLKIGEVEMQFKRQVTGELYDVRQRLEELKVTLPAAHAVRDVKLQQAGSLVGAEPVHSITITRVRNGEATVFEGTKTTALEPGDIIEVKRLRAEVPSNSIASAGQPRLAAASK